MYYPFKERQYSPLSSFSPVENLPILKRECEGPLKSRRQARCCPSALASAVLCRPRWWPRDRDAASRREGCGSVAAGGCPRRGPCSDTSADRMRAAFLGVRQQGWKYKRGNQVKPLLGCRSPAHTLLSCSLECTTWEAFADCGVCLVIFSPLLKLQTQNELKLPVPTTVQKTWKM